MKRNYRVNNATLPPLTPTIPALTPVSRPTVVPDLRVEEVIFQMYLRQREIAEWAMERYRHSEKRFSEFRAKGLARGIAKRLKPAHSDKVPA